MDRIKKWIHKTPRMQKWGSKVTAKILATDSDLCQPQKKAILNILDALSQPTTGNIIVCPRGADNWKVACCLPYVLASLSVMDEYRSTSKDFRKPVLMLATSQTLTSLEEKLSTGSLDGAMAYFRNNGLLSDSDINKGAFYRTFILKTQLDAAKVKQATCSHDIILADMQYLSQLPKDSFSAVFVHASHKLSPDKVRPLRTRFGLDIPILLFNRAHPRYQTDGKSTTVPNLMVRDGSQVSAGITLSPTRKWRGINVGPKNSSDLQPLIGPSSDYELDMD